MPPVLGHRLALVEDCCREPYRHAYEEAGGTGVPLFVIAGRRLTGLEDRETLAAVIEEELARQGDSPA